MLRRALAPSLGLALLFGAVPAGAHNLTPTPTRVNGLAASASNGVVAVDGTASFGGQPLVSVGTDPADDFALPMYDLLEAKVGQLDPSTGDLTFVFKLKDLPFNGSLPEAARYTWDFAIDMGGETPVALQVDGKFTDVLRRQSTRTPSFVLRGNCTTDDNNIITCVDVANLTAEMIGTDNEIFVDVPKAVLQEQAKGSVDGRSLLPEAIFEGIGAHPAGYFSLSGTGDTLVWDAESNPYTVAYKRVRVTATPAGGSAGQPVEATLAPDGSFSASLEGLVAGTYTVTAEACFGTNCETKSVSVTV